jgi:hypothetical protein
MRICSVREISSINKKLEDKMRKLIILLLLTGSAAILNGCRSSNPDGIKSETYSKKTNTAKQIVIE